MQINTLTLSFDNVLAPYEIPLFRGAIIHSLDCKRLLFHNHEGEGFRYAYPLIQYKRLDGKAAIVCINQGTEDIAELLSSPVFTLKIGTRETEMHISDIAPQTYNVDVGDSMTTYHIDNWCALNEKNWQRYNDIEGLAERILFLEHILTGNILSFAKGIGWHIEKEIKCKILSLDNVKPRNIKGVKMVCLDADFQSNVWLPEHIGLGKHVSINFGTLSRKTKQ